MSCGLALECSSVKGSLALWALDEKRKKITLLAKAEWTHQAKTLGLSHSDRLPLEIGSLLKKAKKKLSDLKYLALGAGPGRWTGVRTGLNTAKALSFSLKIPVYPVNSLRICAEPFLSQFYPLLTAFNSFKNQVYFSKFNSLKDLEGEPCLLTFEDWMDKMRATAKRLKGQKALCLSDLEDFYPLPKDLKKAFSFKKFYPKAEDLAQIVFRQREKREPKAWFELKAFYLRSPLE